MIRNSDYLKILRDSWPIVLISTIAFTGAGAFAQPTPKYQSTATLAVTACVPFEQVAGCDPIRGTSFAVQRSQIYANLGMTAPVLKRVGELVDFSIDENDLRIETAVTSQSGLPIVEVTVVWPVADQSAELANAVASALIDYAAVTIDSMPTDAGSTELFVAEQAVTPVQAPPPSVSLTVIGFVLGLALGLGVALLRYVLDRHLRSSGEGEAVTGLDDLASIPVGPLPLKRDSSSQLWLNSSADAFRRLRTGVLFRTESIRGRTILVASSQPGESSSEVARGLAQSLAETCSQVLLVEVDLDLGRKIEVAPSDADNSPGEPELTPTVRGLSQAGEGSLYRVAVTDLRSVRSAALRSVMPDTSVKFDYVVISSPPLLPTADGISLIPTSDVVLLVAGVGVVRRDDLKAAVRAITLVGGTAIGITTTLPVSAKSHAKMAR